MAVQTLVPRPVECARVANVRSAELFAAEEQAPADCSVGQRVDGSFLADLIPDGSAPADCSTGLWVDDWAQLGSVPACLARACLAPAELVVLQTVGLTPADYSARADPSEQRCFRGERLARSSLAELPRDSPERYKAPQFVSRGPRRGR